VVGERNGTYSFNVSEVEGYFLQPEHGVFTVQGTVQVSVDVTYALEYPLTFVAVALPSTVLWDLRIAGFPSMSFTHNASIRVMIPAGNWSYAIVTRGRYMAEDSAGTLAVNNSSMTQYVLFVTPPASAVFVYDELVGIERALPVAGAFALGAVVTFVLLLRRRDDLSPDAGAAAAVPPGATADPPATAPSSSRPGGSR